LICFAAAKGSPKAVEFASNDKVAFTSQVGDSRVTKATIRKSKLIAADIADGIAKTNECFKKSGIAV
jgi:hypothetical protein